MKILIFILHFGFIISTSFDSSNALAIENNSNKCSTSSTGIILHKSGELSPLNISWYKEIDSYIKNLKPQRKLTFKNDISAKAEETADKFFVIKHEPQIIDSNELLYEFPVNEGPHILHPGAIVQVDHRIIKGSPEYIPLHRAPINISVNLERLEDPGFEFNFGVDNYQGQLNKKLNEFYEKYENTSDTKLNFDFYYDLVQTKQEMVSKFGVKAGIFYYKLHISEEKILRKESTVAIIRAQQHFFDVTALPPLEPSKLFDTTQSVDDLKDRFDSDSIPAFIDKIHYGRLIYIKIESSSDSNQVTKGVEAAVSYLQLGASAGGSIFSYNQLENLKVMTLISGGSSGQTRLITTTNLDEIRKIISEYSKLSAKNPAAPLSFTAMYLANQKRVEIDNTIWVPKTEVYTNRSINLVTSTREGYYDVHLSYLEMRREMNGTLSLIPQDRWLAAMHYSDYFSFTILKTYCNVRIKIYQQLKGNITMIFDKGIPEMTNTYRYIQFQKWSRCHYTENCTYYIGFWTDIKFPALLD